MVFSTPSNILTMTKTVSLYLSTNSKDTLKYKDKMLKIPNMYYIFEKQEVHGFKIWHSNRSAFCWSSGPDDGVYYVFLDLFFVSDKSNLRVVEGCSEAFKVNIVVDHYFPARVCWHLIDVSSSDCYFDWFLILYLSNSTKISTNSETILNVVHMFVHTKLTQST